jgi:ribosomal protein S17E
MLFNRKKNNSDDFASQAFDTINRYRELLNKSYKENKKLIEWLIDISYFYEGAGYVEEAIKMRDGLTKLLEGTEKQIAQTEASI